MMTTKRRRLKKRWTRQYKGGSATSGSNRLHPLLALQPVVIQHHSLGFMRDAVDILMDTLQQVAQELLGVLLPESSPETVWRSTLNHARLKVHRITRYPHQTEMRGAGGVFILILFSFYNCSDPLAFLPWEIWVAFPRESLLWQSRYPTYGVR